MRIKLEAKLSYGKTAERFKVGIATLMRWAKRITPLEQRNKPCLKISRQALMEDIEKYPDAFQRERAARLGVSKHGIYWALKKIGVTYKKNPSSIRRRRLLPEKLLKQR